MENKIEKVNPETYGLEKKEATTIEQAFEAKIIEREGYAKIYAPLIEKEITKETVKEARELRLKLVKTRTGISNIHKTQKAYFLAAGKFVDAWKNKETLPVVQMEENLQKIENHFEIIEKIRLANIHQEREKQLKPFINEPVNIDLSTMDQEVWEAYLMTKKNQFQEAKEKREQAEKERLEKIEAERIERERIKKENEQLKIEAEKKEAQAKKERQEREEAERVRLQAEAKERAKREEKEKKERQEAQAKLNAEREEKERLQKQIRDKEAEELRIKQEAEAKAQEELKKGDAGKLKSLFNDFEQLKTKYVFKSKTNQKKYTEAGILIDKIINHFNTK